MRTKGERLDQLFRFPASLFRVRFSKATDINPHTLSFSLVMGMSNEPDVLFLFTFVINDRSQMSQGSQNGWPVPVRRLKDNEECEGY